MFKVDWVRNFHLTAHNCLMKRSKLIWTQVENTVCMSGMINGDIVLGGHLETGSIWKFFFIYWLEMSSKIEKKLINWTLVRSNFRKIVSWILSKKEILKFEKMILVEKCFIKLQIELSVRNKLKRNQNSFENCELNSGLK